MPRVLVAGRIHPDGLDLLRTAPDFSIDYVEDLAIEAYVPFIALAEAILIRAQPLPATVIAQAKHLRFVSRHGVGFDSVDVAALDARQIPLAIVGDVNSRAVAEHTIMLMLAAAKGLLRYDRAARTDNWRYRDSLTATELDGKLLVVVGFGRIGRRVAELAKAFGMRVSAYDPYQSPASIGAAGTEAVIHLEEGLAVADFVTLHAPKTSAPLLDDSALRRIKRGAVIVNTARGGLIDEAALAEALRDERIAAAGLDVLDREPPPADMELLNDDRVVFTPHVASLTRECAARMSAAAARNIIDFFAGRLDPALVVNARSK